MLAQKIQKIKHGIDTVAKEPVTIVVATKTINVDVIKQLPALGINIAGENRAQELIEKQPQVPGLEWHFIGQLQTNKVRQIIDKVSMIQSVDRMKLAAVIQTEAERVGKVMDVLIEVNAGNEESKGGIELGQVEEFVKEVAKLPNLKIRGLMSVMPINADENIYRQMRTLFERLRERNDSIKYLSMGMSGDYLTAVKCGANMIRLGSAIFGERDL